MTCGDRRPCPQSGRLEIRKSSSRIAGPRPVTKEVIERARRGEFELLPTSERIYSPVPSMEAGANSHPAEERCDGKKSPPKSSGANARHIISNGSADINSRAAAQNLRRTQDGQIVCIDTGGQEADRVVNLGRKCGHHRNPRGRAEVIGGAISLQRAAGSRAAPRHCVAVGEQYGGIRARGLYAQTRSTSWFLRRLTRHVHSTIAGPVFAVHSQPRSR